MGVLDRLIGRRKRNPLESLIATKGEIAVENYQQQTRKRIAVALELIQDMLEEKPKGKSKEARINFLLGVEQALKWALRENKRISFRGQDTLTDRFVEGAIKRKND